MVSVFRSDRTSTYSSFHWSAVSSEFRVCVCVDESTICSQVCEVIIIGIRSSESKHGETIKYGQTWYKRNAFAIRHLGL